MRLTFELIWKVISQKHPRVGHSIRRAQGQKGPEEERLMGSQMRAGLMRRKVGRERDWGSGEDGIGQQERDNAEVQNERNTVPLFIVPGGLQALLALVWIWAPPGIRSVTTSHTYILPVICEDDLEPSHCLFSYGLWPKKLFFYIFKSLH